MADRDVSVTVTLVEGRGVRARKKSSTALVFVRLQIDCETFESTAATASSPDWSRESFDCVRSAGDLGVLTVQLIEKVPQTGQAAAEELLAESKVPLKSEGFDKWLELDKRKGRGELRISVKATPLPSLESMYHISQRLGRGAHSIVFAGTKLDTGELVAIKSISKENESPQDLRALMREIDIMKRLSHPSIVRLHDVLVYRKKIHLIMDHVDGMELLSVIGRHGGQEEGAAKRVFAQMAQAVDYLHSMGVAHRDLKPENVLISGDIDAPTVKLVDFGLSRDCCQNGMLTMCGSPSYVAPEVLQCQPYTVQCDMWSLGVILFALLSGQLPFTADTEEQLFAAVAKGTFDMAGAQWSGVSKAAQDLVRGLLVVDPARRMTSSQCLAHKWLEGAGSPAPSVLEYNPQRIGNEVYKSF
eukprot:m51a1_g1008 putative myosin light chain (415) ;mRNA; f:593414-595412